MSAFEAAMKKPRPKARQVGMEETDWPQVGCMTCRTILAGKWGWVKVSFVEAIASTFVGFCVSWALTFFVLPIWGIEPSAGQAMEITAVYTLASFIRSWAVRAAFRRFVNV